VLEKALTKSDIRRERGSDLSEEASRTIVVEPLEGRSCKSSAFIDNHCNRVSPCLYICSTKCCRFRSRF
jgi:hypothetical protein